MSIYEKKYIIESHDVDMHRKLRLSQLFTFMQEAAIHHTEELGAGRDKTLDKGFLWVVTMQYADIRRLPEYDESITVRSWPGETMHVMFPRFYEIDDEKGETIVTGSALWMLMDMKDRKMIFPDEHGISIDARNTGHDPALPKPLRPLECEDEFSFHVPYSYTDINGHLSNTRYFDIAEDLLDESEIGRISHAAVEYSNEARYRDDIDIGIHKEKEQLYLSGNREGKKLFRLLLKY